MTCGIFPSAVTLALMAGSTDGLVMPSDVWNTTDALSPAALGKSRSRRSSASCDWVCGMRKVSLN